MNSKHLSVLHQRCEISIKWSVVRVNCKINDFFFLLVFKAHQQEITTNKNLKAEQLNKELRLNLISGSK